MGHFWKSTGTVAASPRIWRSACDHRPAPAATLGAASARLMRESVTGLG